MLLLLRNRLALLLLLHSSIGSLQRRRSAHVAIGREWLADSDIGWTAVIGSGKLRPVGAGSALILNLSTHGRGVRLMHCHQLRRAGRRPNAA